MTSSLRQEIFTYIDSCINNEGKLIESPETIRDNLVAKIEKRIDSTNEQKENHNYSGEEDFIDGFSLGFDFALEKLKEMLK